MIHHETRTSFEQYKNSLRDVSPLDAEQERELAVQAKAGDLQAAHKLTKALLPFVIHIARRYRRWGIPLEDLVQQGNIGLLKAVEKYELDKNCRLVTYASYWIRAEIRDYVVRGYRIVRLGTTRTERQAIRMFRKEGIESPEVLAEQSQMPLARAKKLWPLLASRDAHLESPAGESATLMDRMADTEQDPEQHAIHEQGRSLVREAMKEALAKLGDRERRIIEQRVLAEQPRTLQAIGNEMGVSKERVRQLEQRAQSQLREQLSAFSGLVAA